MNDIHSSYAILELTPGTSLELINQRYKRLVMSWHPDKFRGVDAKATAERELKKINNARDILRDHFRSGGHSDRANCECRPAPEKTNEKPKNKRSSEPNSSKSNEAFSTFRQSAQNTPPSKETNSFSDNVRYFDDCATSRQHFHNLFRRNRKVDAGYRVVAAIFCALFLLVLVIVTGISDVFAMTSTFIRHKIHIDQHNPAFVQTNKNSDWSNLGRGTTKVVAPLSDDDFHRQCSTKLRPSTNELSSAINDIEGYSNYIAFSKRKMREIDLILNAPDVSTQKLRFAISDRDIQSKFLRENEENLVFARRRLTETIRSCK